MNASSQLIVLIGSVTEEPKVWTDENVGQRRAILRVATKRKGLAVLDVHRVYLARPGLVNMASSLVKKGDRVYVEGVVHYDGVPDGTDPTTCATIHAHNVLMASMADE